MYWGFSHKGQALLEASEIGGAGAGDSGLEEARCKSVRTWTEPKVTAAFQSRLPP